MGVPGALQRRGQLHPLGDLRPGEPLVDHAQRLVVEVGVQVALLGKEGEGVLAAPDRPVVRGEDDVGGGAEELDGLGQVVGPVVRVADLGAAQREQVVQGVCGVLGGAQGGVLGEVDVELGRGFGARGHVEHHADAVDGFALPGARDAYGRRDQGDRARRRRGAQPRADLPARALGQGGAVHVRGAAAHGCAGVDVLADGVLQEPLRSEHRDAGRDLLDADHALDAAEVVGVAVRVQDAGDGALPAVAAVQRERGGRGLRGDERSMTTHTTRPSASRISPCSAVPMNPRRSFSGSRVSPNARCRSAASLASATTASASPDEAFTVQSSLSAGRGAGGRRYRWVLTHPRFLRPGAPPSLLHSDPGGLCIKVRRYV